jgi:hypothetical protein
MAERTARVLAGEDLALLRVREQRPPEHPSRTT